MKTPRKNQLNRKTTLFVDFEKAYPLAGRHCKEN